MGNYIQVLTFVIIAAALLWFGYSLFFGHGGKTTSAFFARRKERKRLCPERGELSKEPQTCPVCSAKLFKGELIKSSAFPSLNGGKDRMMHIQGCVYCLMGNRARVCPVCKGNIREEQFLVARIFDRGLRRSHVHVLGCSNCRNA